MVFFGGVMVFFVGVMVFFGGVMVFCEYWWFSVEFERWFFVKIIFQF